MSKELEESTKAREIAEIERRIDYLISTDQISDSEKVKILKEALAASKVSGVLAEVIS